MSDADSEVDSGTFSMFSQTSAVTKGAHSKQKMLDSSKQFSGLRGHFYATLHHIEVHYLVQHDILSRRKLSTLYCKI